MAATYKDIQNLTGLSLSTISKYFNGISVSPKNHAAIQTAAESLDYRVNVFAQSLKSRRSRAIGILIPALYEAFNSSVMSKVGSCLREQGYGVLVSETCAGNDSLESEALEFLLDRQVDGLVIVAVGFSASYLRGKLEQRIPMVIVDSLFDEIQHDAAILNNRKAGGMAAELLLQNGHKNIGIISGPKWAYSMRERKWGFWRTLQQHGIQPDSGNYFYGDFTVESGQKAALKLLSKKNRPTALFALSDLLTLGMVSAVQQLGLSVPEEISLIGFDNMMISGVLGKPLTMLTQPIDELARQASLLILDQIENGIPDKKRISMIEPILHPGATVHNLILSETGDL